MKKAVLGGAAVATLLAALFAPEDEGSIVGPATATPRQVERVAVAPLVVATAAAPANRALAIEPRRGLDDEEAATLFAKQSWQPETPKKIMLDQQAAQATRTVAAVDANAPPPLPFQFLGRFVDEGKAAYFLQAGERNVVARPGDTLEERYRFDGVVQGALQFTYLPLNLKQTLAVGDIN
ncbi:hypothetical protein JAB5_49430 [Janthinobacterium sp. HH103]|jgi:hypothetical protein|uniref:Secretion system X translation initiation factor n=1 Tax=Janthinobacterium agaricidamnosum TaxID=55508 RepID=A0A3G2EDN4_9BURK|nr:MULTISPECIES: hypothetical protein [Janthinobacterium]AYM78391.1 hypothetical protein D9M09_23270 [Janthinobacterium agaricidamnosum]OEZ67973.1 hypothetical protein JAB2_19760 [Janthinobacterium sp. HH100]OEZ68525.1 hypothetical protein JAB5_49430 [Janthinobacterium sp. HH103]OEZ85739.1 hypothetical protein JAB8_39220 [Janthinobacterium sp. HH106]QOU75778.1 hypothetical protein JAB4_052660 [Janthinobacterium sp. HH102]